MRVSHYGWMILALGIVGLVVGISSTRATGEDKRSPAEEKVSPDYSPSAPFAPVPAEVVHEILHLRRIVGKRPAESPAFEPYALNPTVSETAQATDDRKIIEDRLFHLIQLPEGEVCQSPFPCATPGTAWYGPAELPPIETAGCQCGTYCQCADQVAGLCLPPFAHPLLSGSDSEVSAMACACGPRGVSGAEFLACAEAPSKNPVGVLRDAAFRLDEVAQMLECTDQYEQADDIRAVANKIRRDARVLKSGSGLSPVSGAPEAPLRDTQALRPGLPLLKVATPPVQAASATTKENR